MSKSRSLTELAVRDSDETTAVVEVIEAARGLGVAHLPDADRLITGRVWPGGDGWVGEIGEGQNIRALDDMFASMVDAIKAVQGALQEERSKAVNLLMSGGVEAARLATTRETWQPPVLKVFAEVAQQEPWLLQLPA